MLSSPFSIALHSHVPSISEKTPGKTTEIKNTTAQAQSAAAPKRNLSFPAKGMAHYKRMILALSASSDGPHYIHTPAVSNIKASKEMASLKNAITSQNKIEVLEKLEKFSFSPEVVQHFLTFAFKIESHAAIKEVLLERLGYEPSDVLELAVEYNDISIAKLALQNGADPEKITVGHANDEMRALVAYARRRNKLYPPNTDSENETDLDRALRNGLDADSRKEAEDLLRKLRLGKGIPQMWRDAVKNKQPDIQRAILLLGADKNPRFRLLQQDDVTDEGIAEVMKEIPYFSPKRPLLQNLNCQATFADNGGKEIACRHFVEHWQTVREQNPGIKFDYAQFSNREAIEANVSYDTEKRYDHLLAHAAETHLLHNRDFGNTLVHQFETMEARGESNRLIALTSTNHVMSVELEIKEKDGKPHYVVEFFDPEVTTSHVRIASNNLRTFETLTLKNFIAEQKTYENCYPRGGEISTIFVRPKTTEEEPADPAQGVAANRVLTSSIEDLEINATAFWHLFSNGFAGDLRRLKDEIACRPVEERIQLLAAKDAAGTPGLYMALQNGHADAVRAFGELLDLLPQETEQEIWAELLAAKRINGMPGLYMALQNGHADTVRAFGELLTRIPQEIRAELLTANNTDGIPGFNRALEFGHTDAIKAFGELLRLVSLEDRVKLLAAKDAYGFPGLYLALKNGHADSIKAFGELLALLPQEMRAELLVAKNADGVSGLAEALIAGHVEAIKAFGEALRLVPPEMCADLVAAKGSKGIPGLAVALLKKDIEAIKAYGELLALVPQQQRGALIDANADKLLSMALQEAPADVREAFEELPSYQDLL